MIGIYKITSPSKKVYIGQSANINKRKNVYKNADCRGQIKIYNSLKKYGFSNHKFEIVCECEIYELNDKERYYQELFSSIGKMGLNLKLTKATDRKCQISEETKLKISIANRIVNAKKRGDFDKNIDYSIRVEKQKKNKKINNHIAYYEDNNIFFPYTGEYFKSIKKLFTAHKDKFSTYIYACKIVKKNSKKPKLFS